jgi:transcriptional regulator with XRE-family HTH domain
MTKPTGKTPVHRRKIGQAIRSIRESIGLSQEKLAELADVHRNYIGLVERGEQNLTVDSFIRIAKSLDRSPSKLMAEAGL